MCNFCSNCGSNLREQKSVDLPIESAFVEIGEYDHDDLCYQIEGDVPLYHCTKCGSISMTAPASLDDLTQAANSSN